MLAPEFTLSDDFPPISHEAWRSLAEAYLEGAPFEQTLVPHTYEGIDIQPVYTCKEWPSERDPDGFPGLSPDVRGARALYAGQTCRDIRQKHGHPDPAVTDL